jgi:hypothetical protein
MSMPFHSYPSPVPVASPRRYTILLAHCKELRPKRLAIVLISQPGMNFNYSAGVLTYNIE